ncbi:MAG: hypothetical protein WCI00_04360 [bacterium]
MKAFGDDMKTLKIISPEITKILAETQDFIDLKQIDKIDDKDHLLHLKGIAQNPKMNIQIQDPLDEKKKV